jgi:hypothetical protein
MLTLIVLGVALAMIIANTPIGIEQPMKEKTWQAVATGDPGAGASGLTLITITYNYPLDNARNIQLQPTIYATINHSLSRTMNMTIYYSTNQTNINTFLTTYSNITNSTQYTTMYPADTRSTQYYWRIQANDGTNTLNFTYNFQTEGYPGGGTGGIITTNVYGIIAIIFSILGIMALLIIWIKKREE